MELPVCRGHIPNPADTRRKNNVIITPKRRRDVGWRHSDVIIALCARWEEMALEIPVSLVTKVTHLSFLSWYQIPYHTGPCYIDSVFDTNGPLGRSVTIMPFDACCNQIQIQSTWWAVSIASHYSFPYLNKTKDGTRPCITRVQSIPKLQQCNRLSLGMGTKIHPTFY